MGVGAGPASSARRASVFRGSASPRTRSLPARARTNDASACRARSPPSASTSAGSRSRRRTAGIAERSPLRARSISARTSSAGAAGLVGCSVALGTSPPPLAALVPVIAGREERRLGRQVGQFVQLLEPAVEGFHFPSLRPPGRGQESPLLPVEVVH